MPERKSGAAPGDAGEMSLRVAEALVKDVGRGIARLDPKDLGRLGAVVGDILAITGERTTVAITQDTGPRSAGCRGAYECVHQEQQ